MLIPIFILGQQQYRWAHDVWAEHWLHQDGTSISALVTQTGPKRRIDYSYAADGKEFTGTGVRDWEDEKEHELKAGDKTPVIVSASHPWLSYPPSSRSAWMGLPLVLIILVFQFGLLIAAFTPKGGWAGKTFVITIARTRQRQL